MLSPGYEMTSSWTKPVQFERENACAWRGHVTTCSRIASCRQVDKWGKKNIILRRNFGRRQWQVDRSVDIPGDWGWSKCRTSLHPGWRKLWEGKWRKIACDSQFWCSPMHSTQHNSTIYIYIYSYLHLVSLFFCIVESDLWCTMIHQQSPCISLPHKGIVLGICKASGQDKALPMLSAKLAKLHLGISRPSLHGSTSAVWFSFATVAV